MHCRACRYALWNLREARCPECGLNFDVNTYRFVPGTVEFTCANCDQVLAGHDVFHRPCSDGEEPWSCPGCQESLAGNRISVTPLDKDEFSRGFDPLPWADRERSMLNAWYHTALLLHERPEDIGRNIYLEPSIGQGYTFWLLSYVFAVVTFIPLYLISALVLTAIAWCYNLWAHNSAHVHMAEFVAILGIIGVMGVAVGIVAIIGLPLLIVAGGLIAHLWLIVRGQRTKPITQTVSAMLYTASLVFPATTLRSLRERRFFNDTSGPAKSTAKTILALAAAQGIAYQQASWAALVSGVTVVGAVAGGWFLMFVLLGI